MENRGEKLVTWLFKTEALKVCPGNKPFWYTSGTIGPYYINTHFLYGSEKKANELLKFIDSEKENVFEFPVKLTELLKANYRSDEIYKGLIDEMCKFIEENIDIDEIDYISGGERRDWFFSPIIADMLKKPHIYIYKDMKAYFHEGTEVKEAESIQGKKVLHIADLITEASSYERNWIPAVRDLEGVLKWSTVVVDRKQGGKELLESFKVTSLAMITVDNELFDSALSQGLINLEQYAMILNFIENPRESMKKFLESHPEFLENALVSDDKTRARAELCIQKDIYGLKEEK
ncbi:MAG: orotate phosphoribosyltransferase [Bacillota bacterium]|nr:orotate phosphoribosyltransferase [Bacillota bacterium]